MSYLDRRKPLSLKYSSHSFRLNGYSLMLLVTLP